MDIELDERGRFISLTKLVNGKPQTRVVPMANVAAFEVIEPVQLEKLAKK